MVEIRYAGCEKLGGKLNTSRPGFEISARKSVKISEMRSTVFIKKEAGWIILNTSPENHSHWPFASIGRGKRGSFARVFLEHIEADQGVRRRTSSGQKVMDNSFTGLPAAAAPTTHRVWEERSQRLLCGSRQLERGQGGGEFRLARSQVPFRDIGSVFIKRAGGKKTPAYPLDWDIQNTCRRKS